MKAAAEASKRWREAHPERAKEVRRLAARRYYEQNPDVYKNGHRKRLYRLTPEQFAAMLESQGGACAICRKDQPGGKGSWHVDHDHKTGLVRGLLCAGCNVGLGHFRDNPESLAAAAAYLRRAAESHS